MNRVMVDIGANTGVVARLTEQFPDQAVAKVDRASFLRLLKHGAGVYLMDPIGNIFMVYAEEKAGKPMLKDIKHLLKISNIG